jgi:mono/diheme cytochrome c family protein
MPWRSRTPSIATVFIAAAFAARAACAQARAESPAPGELTPFEKAKAETLIRDQLPCLGCHTLDGKGGKLAPELSTVSTRRDAQYIARIVTDPQGTVPGTFMPHTPMPQPWRALIVRYLRGDASTLVPTSIASGAATNASDMSVALRPVSASPTDTSGAVLYARFCTGCHGPQGKGDGPNATSLPVPPAKHASREAMSARPDDALFDTIAGGGAIMNRSPRMPAYGTTLTSPQIRALVRHIRALCQCAGPAWSSDGAGAPR